VQVGFMVRDADRALAIDQHGALRRLLQQADELIPAAAVYAATSPVRADNARYYLYPRQAVVTGFSRRALERSGVRWVIVTRDAVPQTLRGERRWYRVAASTSAGRVLEVTG
jgi:hypothetical protein